MLFSQTSLESGVTSNSGSGYTLIVIVCVFDEEPSTCPVQLLSVLTILVTVYTYCPTGNDVGTNIVVSTLPIPE